MSERPGKPLQLHQKKFETGYASYYSMSMKGNKTASGERYDPYQLTAAHPSLPFGTIVRVTNLFNNESVVVRINDRGPKEKSRIIDLSYAAAQKLDMISAGIVQVAIEVLSLPEQNK
ncbi:MAG: septal ring lytic transglycosylase RlpA family protein [candidate division KSB1 bacterium]|nr:septal ring lytic transglycosylase RlpA family protein [candidate division KSB1 bacterium]MDZ7335569.1 septal ring lytic transglycosylase RlpA family protein [candidate division KSB1 bacterium]MDZ7356441.1 septal ring lytic transglycosylase RlpA family protein [candidate division KSB1 bacterium]MDZ7377454.1 septal ring lytic transglycosylase RlpA family protein [candidate division KSB1 bacterium]MDZ7401212.1 septal ring lytic transglycosylase RlpA family protein [candidate division KSB1 bact